MTFWSSERFRERSNEGVVEPFDAENVKHGAYELAVAGEYVSTKPEGDGDRVVLESGQHISLDAGQFAILLTDETVTVPSDAIGFISMKAGWKLKGLMNVSGFHVDPGFHGRLKFSVYNAGGHRLDLGVGERLFLIWFADLDRATEDLYNGDHNNQQGITSDEVNRVRGLVPSPAGLSAQIADVVQSIKDLDQSFSGKLADLKTTLAWRIGPAMGAGAILMSLATTIAVIPAMKSCSASASPPPPAAPASIMSDSIRQHQPQGSSRDTRSSTATGLPVAPGSPAGSDNGGAGGDARD